MFSTSRRLSIKCSTTEEVAEGAVVFPSRAFNIFKLVASCLVRRGLEALDVKCGTTRTQCHAGEGASNTPRQDSLICGRLISVDLEPWPQHRQTLSKA